MKSWLWQGMLAVAFALPALSGMARAQSSDDDGCTNGTLKGDYPVSVVDFILPKVVVGIGWFDGGGGYSQVDYIDDSLRTTGATSFRGGETGSYTVNPDCTGTLTAFNGHLVVDDNGKEYREIFQLAGAVITVTGRRIRSTED